MRKTGSICKQDYDLKPGVANMSALEIMRTYAEALPAAGMKITNSNRNDDDDVFATIARDGATYWAHVWESNGNSLHVVVLKETPFRAQLTPAGADDCPIIPIQQNFQIAAQRYLRTYDLEQFREGDQIVKKYGRICNRDYNLKPGLEIMSALEIMRNYEEAAASTGYKITNTSRNPDDDIFASMTKDGASYWFHIWESNGDTLHITTLQEAPFQASVAPLTSKDCPLTPALQTFQTADPPRSKTYEAMDFQTVEDNENKIVTKKGSTCRQDYALKPGVSTISALELMQNYAEALPAEGLQITNTLRDPDQDIFATMTKDGVEFLGARLGKQRRRVAHRRAANRAVPFDDEGAATRRRSAGNARAGRRRRRSPSLALPAPAATPETIDPASGDFPYLPSLPGSRLASGRALSNPFYVKPSDAKQAELVARGSIIKVYSAQPGSTAIQILDAYRAALLKAQWSIVSEQREAPMALTGHYGLNGRNIWATLHINDQSYMIAVADATVGEAALAENLGSQCHLALTGVLFDFNKSKLKPESDAVLVQVAAVLQKTPDLRLEVQGHTDGVGSEGYNLPLSKARAHSVVAWLTDHGVAAARLDARGYGKTRPIASNDTDEGRAQNRRVEVANPACKTP